jgi:adenine-specific DNA-methyltransferase
MRTALAAGFEPGVREGLIASFGTSGAEDVLGLTVLAQGHGGGVQWVEGTNPEGDKVLVLWRNTTEVDADALNDWCKKQKVSVLDGEFGLIYINGDHHLENLRREDQTWKVRLTDEELPKLMWEGC